MRRLGKISGFLMSGTVLLVFAGCGGGGSTGTQPVPTAHNEWTWVGGAAITNYPNNTNYPGIYGTQGVAAAGNFPGGRIWPISWTDENGNLWLFGGYGVGSNYTAGEGRLNDLWEFNPKSKQWTWVSGSTQINQPGVYGTQGVASTGNIPGGREGAVSWRDTSGNFWLFGGTGVDSTGTPGGLNDLWKYSSASNTWTWMSGSSLASTPAGTMQPGVYGTQGVAAPGNLPGARFGASAWTDTSGNLWLFGGSGVDSTGIPGNLNDLWKYSPTTNMWIWMNGPNIANQDGVYGTQGVAAPSNFPASCCGTNSWTDTSRNLWLFGGIGGYNDLWKYNPATNMWTWINGPDQSFQPGVYGTKGVAAPGNLPWFRDDAASWTDAAGNFWLYGGSPGGFIDFDDVWKYDPATNLWTWVSGSDNSCPASVYGSFGVPAPGNTPGGRLGGASWTDKSGNFWFFGGENFCNGSGTYNDLWEYQP